jgi:hypothetical protein
MSRADGVQAADRPVLAIEHLRRAVGLQAGEGAEAAGCTFTA